MNELDEQDIESMRNVDRWAATVIARQLRGECVVCGGKDCTGCEDYDENDNAQANRLA